jgi:SAM-dependent methyltransferase
MSEPTAPVADDAGGSVDEATALRLRSYAGQCEMCGAKGEFVGTSLGARESFPCPTCRATLRYREQAGAILTRFGRGRFSFFTRFVRFPECQKLSILEAAIRGPFTRYLKGHPGYVQSYLFDDIAPGDSRDGVVCQTLEAMTFADESFDLVITSDVMEHVADVGKVVAEVARVLKPGGAHVFSIPLKFPLRDHSQARARLVGGEVEHLMEPRYHRSGTDTPSLVFTDFGRDLLDLHARHGLRASLHRSHPFVKRLAHSAAVIAVRP